MSSSDSDSDSDVPRTSGPHIKPFKTAMDHPLWSKLVLNHLSGNEVLPAVLDTSGLVASFATAPAGDPDSVDAALSAAAQGKTISTTKRARMNVKAYSLVFARLHHSVIADLSSESSDPTKPNARVLCEELCKRYGGGEMQQLISSIHVIP